MEMPKGEECLIIFKPRCKNCGVYMKYMSCIECGKELVGTFKSKKIVCFGPEGETRHMCRKCYKKLQALKCPKCDSEKIYRWNVDEKDGTKSIVNGCKKCNYSWKGKKK